MFTSISACTPNTIQTTSYVATRSHSLNISSSITVRINGEIAASRPIAVTIGAAISVTVTSPAEYLAYNLYSYTIDSVDQYFAVVNKNNYTPVLKSENEGQRWYNYPAQNHTLSFKSPNQPALDLAFSQGTSKLTAALHAITDPLSSTVYFYTQYGWPVSKVTLPLPPILCQLIQRTLPFTDEVEEFYLALSNTGKLYRINLDRTTLASSAFEVEIYSSWIFEDYYDIDLEFRGSFISVARARQKNALKPNVTSFGFDGTNIWLAGRAALWILDLDFNIVNEFAIPEFVNGLVLANDHAFITTQNSDVYRITNTGQLDLIYQSQAVGPPEVFDGYVYVPECNHARLVKINIQTLEYEFIQLANVSPAYLKADSTGLYISCHDSNQVFLLQSDNSITSLQFEDKVTWVSAINGFLIASHWLKDFVLLVDGLQKIIPISLRARRGTMTHIGTAPVKIKTIGETTLNVVVPAGVSILANGSLSTTISNNDYLGISYLATVPGARRLPIIIGEDAFDYDVEAVQSTTGVRNVEFDITEINDTSVTIFATMPTVVAATASIEYGTILINGVKYTGQASIAAGDTLEIVIPMYKNQMPIVPIFTLETRQFAVPISVSTSLTKNELFDLATGQLVEEQAFTVLQSGTYTTPRYSVGNIAFKKNEIAQETMMFEAVAGDIITISNFLSSSRIYDEKSVFIVGPHNFELSTRTIGQSLVPFITFTDLVDPYAETEEPYVSNNVTINGAGVLGANLVINDSSANFIVNDTTQDQNVTVFNGDQLAVSRTLRSYYESPLLLYQVQADDTQVDLIQCGIWPIVNFDLAAEIYHEFNDHNLPKDYAMVGQYNASRDIADTFKQPTNVSVTEQHAAAQQATKFSLSRVAASWLPCPQTANVEFAADTVQLQPATVLLPDFDAALVDNNFLIAGAELQFPVIMPASTLYSLVTHTWVHIDDNQEWAIPQSLVKKDQNQNWILSNNLTAFDLIGTMLLDGYQLDHYVTNTSLSKKGNLVNFDNFSSNIKNIRNIGSIVDFGKAGIAMRNTEDILSYNDTLTLTLHSTQRNEFTANLLNKLNQPALAMFDVNLVVKNNQIQVDFADKNIIALENESAVDKFDNNIFVETTVWEQLARHNFVSKLSHYAAFIGRTITATKNLPAGITDAADHPVSTSYAKLQVFSVFVSDIIMQHKKAEQYAFERNDYAADAPHLTQLVAKEFAVAQPNILPKITNEFAADAPHLVIPLVAIDIEQAPVLPVVLMSNLVQLDIEYIWTSQQLEKYGAFLTEQAAQSAAELAGYENFVTLPIYRSNYYTYDVIVTLDAGCAVPVVSLRPIAWLIRGG